LGQAFGVNEGTKRFVEVEIRPSEGVCFFEGVQTSEDGSCLVSGFRDAVEENLGLLEWQPAAETKRTASLAVVVKELDEITRMSVSEYSAGSITVDTLEDPPVRGNLKAKQKSRAEMAEGGSVSFEFGVWTSYPKQVWLEVVVAEGQGAVEVCQPDCLRGDLGTVEKAIVRGNNMHVIFYGGIKFWGVVHVVGKLWPTSKPRAANARPLDETHMYIDVQPIPHEVVFTVAPGCLSPWLLLPHCFVLLNCFSFADTDPLAFYMVELSLPQAVAIRAKLDAKVAVRPWPDRVRLWGQLDELNKALSEIRIDIYRRLFLGTQDTSFIANLVFTIFSLGRFASTDDLPGLVQLKQDSSLAASLVQPFPAPPGSRQVTHNFAFTIYRDNVPPRVQIQVSKQTLVLPKALGPNFHVPLQGIVFRDHDLETAHAAAPAAALPDVFVRFEAINGLSLTLETETAEVLERSLSLHALNELMASEKLRLNIEEGVEGRGAVQVTVSDLGNFSGCRGFEREDERILRQCVGVEGGEEGVGREFLVGEEGRREVVCERKEERLVDEATVAILIE
jgi:hypothetical protein